MAALVEGQQYGLSAQDKINSNKSIIFLKLTDSALRSIEEYLKQKGNTATKPTIQFQNANGVISLPHNNSCQKFGFTLSNVEADGPQGSFECVRQTKHRSLESLGCMHTKMHIHATEDSYENTRVKMAAAEKEQKMSCTKVIKPSGSHLGRKVKVKRAGIVVATSQVAVKQSPPAPHMRKDPPRVLSPSIPPAKKPDPPQKFQAKPKNKFVNNPDLLKQPMRDRIIHILALRPYKRPELLVRLMSEGIREKDRKGITGILSQVGVLKGNVYHLANYCWNEVQDNWKFNTQEEADVIRKRKQQFLSSNLENEAPPSNTQLSSSSPPQKRLLPDIAPNTQEPRSKKMRISHYSRPEQPSRNDPPDDPSPPPIPPSRPKNFPSPLFPNDGSPQSPPATCDKASNVLPPIQRNGHRSKSPAPQKNGHRSDSPVKTSSKIYNKPVAKVKQTLSHPRTMESLCDSKVLASPDSQFQETTGETTNGYTNGTAKYGSSYVNRGKVTSTTNGSCSNSPHSSSDSRDSMDYNGTDLQVPPPNVADSPTLDYDKYKDGEYDSCQDYEKEFTDIVTNEQRGKYKSYFNAQYDEYLKLHKQIKDISKKFAALERMLHNHPEDSKEFKKIKGMIYKEYRGYQHNPDYVESLKKFNYLHGKLSHIKRLVMEYDNARFGKS